MDILQHGWHRERAEPIINGMFKNNGGIKHANKFAQQMINEMNPKISLLTVIENTIIDGSENIPAKTKATKTAIKKFLNVACCFNCCSLILLSLFRNPIWASFIASSAALL